MAAIFLGLREPAGIWTPWCEGAGLGMVPESEGRRQGPKLLGLRKELRPERARLKPDPSVGGREEAGVWIPRIGVGGESLDPQV